MFSNNFFVGILVNGSWIFNSRDRLVFKDQKQVIVSLTYHIILIKHDEFQRLKDVVQDLIDNLYDQ